MPELTAKQVRAMDCEHQFIDAPRPYSDMNIKSYKVCGTCGAARLRYADGSVVYKLPLDIGRVYFTESCPARTPAWRPRR